MIKTALLIPTLELKLAERCLDSFRPSLEATGTVAIVIYNGSDKNVVSDYSRAGEMIIGYSDSEAIAQAFASAAGRSTEFLFGHQDYNRSYGGASNLLLAVGYAVGAQVLAKIDDDCRAVHPTSVSWMASALELVAKCGGVAYGSYIETGPNYLDLLGEETARGLLKYCYRDREAPGRLSKAENSDLLKNGNLAISRIAIRSSCYPVLHEKITKINVRGEAYFWKEELIKKGVPFAYGSNLSLRHDPVFRKLSSWLRSLIVGFDLSFTHRALCARGGLPSRAERRQAIGEFRNWLAHAEIPETDGVARSELLSLMREEILMGFTDAVIEDCPIRLECWRRLLQRSDLSKLIDGILPNWIQRR